MRLFFAIEVPETWKRSLEVASQGLARQSRRGSFPPRENFHLTLAFLGEVDRLDGVRAALEALDRPGFRLETGGFGRFPGRAGDVWWLGLAPCPELESLREELVRGLEDRGVWYDPQPFRPHLTLGRRVVTDLEPAGLAAPRLEMEVGAVALMESVQGTGGVCYRAVERKRLG